MWGWVLVRVVAFLASEVVLSPVVSLHVGWVLVGVVAFLGSQVVLSRMVSGCLPLCGGRCWLAQVVLSPVVSGLPSCGDGCWFVWGSEVVLSFVVSLHVGL